MQIEKNVPIPFHNGPRASGRYRETLTAMEIGDSIVIEAAARSNVQTYEAPRIGFKFTIRTRGQNLPAGQARCWRVA